VKKRVFHLSLSLMVLGGIGAFFFFPQHKPQYCWLVFGPEAKVRVLVCLDGEPVSLDHYADGKPSGRKEQFKDRSKCKDVAIADPDGKTSYVITSMGTKFVKRGVPTELFVWVDIKGPVEYRQYCDVVEMAGDPETAPTAHFHGPLTVEAQTISWNLPPDLSLRRGDKPPDLCTFVGTMNAKKGCWVVVRTDDGKNQPAFPKGVHPFVDVEFPPKGQGAPPVKRRYPLDQFC
jgi:hypothetical protein